MCYRGVGCVAPTRHIAGSGGIEVFQGLQQKLCAVLVEGEICCHVSGGLASLELKSRFRRDSHLVVLAS